MNTALATVVLSVAVGLIGEALEFSGLAYFGGLLLIMLLVSLTDREGFYGPRRSSGAS